MDSPAGMSLEQLFQEICGEIGGLLRVGGQKRKRVNSSIAVYWYKHSSWPAMQRRGPLSHLPGYAVRDRSYADRDLAYRRVSSLSMGIVPVSSSPGTGSSGGGCSRAAAAGATIPPYPGLDCGGACPGQLQLRLCVLVGMSVGLSGPVGQGCHASILTGFPKVDVMYDRLLLYFRPARLTPFFLRASSRIIDTPCPVLYSCS